MTDIREVENEMDGHPLLEKAFQNLGPENYGPYSLQFMPRTIGNIEVSSGKIIVTDGMVPQETPLKATFPIGIFAIEIAIASWGDDKRVAFSRVIFKKDPPVTWFHANFEGSAPGSMDGFPVDSGTGTYVDYSNRKRVGVYPFGSQFKEISDSLAEKSFDSYKKSGTDISIFTTGYGDGLYASYVGYDADGDICRLVSDFGVVDEFEKAKETYDENYIEWLISERRKFDVKILSFGKEHVSNPMKKDHGVRFNAVEFQVIKNEASSLKTLTIKILRNGSSERDHNQTYCDIDVSNMEVGKWTVRQSFAVDMFMIDFETMVPVFTPEFERTHFQVYMKENNQISNP